MLSGSAVVVGGLAGAVDPVEPDGLDEPGDAPFLAGAGARVHDQGDDEHEQTPTTAAAANASPMSGIDRSGRRWPGGAPLHSGGDHGGFGGGPATPPVP